MIDHTQDPEFIRRCALTAQQILAATRPGGRLVATRRSNEHLIVHDLRPSELRMELRRRLRQQKAAAQ